MCLENPHLEIRWNQALWWLLNPLKSLIWKVSWASRTNLPPMAGNRCIFGRCASSCEVSNAKALSPGTQLCFSAATTHCPPVGGSLNKSTPPHSQSWGAGEGRGDGAQSGQGQINSKRYDMNLDESYLLPLFRVRTPLSHPHTPGELFLNLESSNWQFMVSVTSVHSRPVSWIPLWF